MYLRTGCIQPLRGGYPKGTLPGFIFSGHNFKNARYCVDGRHRRKTTETLRQGFKEKSEKKGRMILCKKTDCMVVCKMKSP